MYLLFLLYTFFFSCLSRVFKVADVYAKEEFDVLLMGGGLWDALHAQGDVDGELSHVL